MNFCLRTSKSLSVGEFDACILYHLGVIFTHNLPLFIAIIIAINIYLVNFIIFTLLSLIFGIYLFFRLNLEKFDVF